ncbi:ATP-grasp domain-containing protein [Actinokineospora sp.]|uniref:ATP-grasp domain-containing protein n=1 Tax=Actinokineospora sp. TaxID=1872133 RepID=UPI003D6A1D35
MKSRKHDWEPDLSGIAELVVKLGCRFVTTDVVRRDDGAWRVVEVGDGQVSDRPGRSIPISSSAH